MTPGSLEVEFVLQYFPVLFRCLLNQLQQAGTKGETGREAAVQEA